MALIPLTDNAAWGPAPELTVEGSVPDLF